MGQLILLRHGQSVWNKQNIFTGWIDIPLSLEGVEEALKGGREIENEVFDVIYTSTLIRGSMTAMLVMNVNKSGKVPYIVHEEEKGFENWRTCYDKNTSQTLLPVYTAWQLNERMYGKLQGLNKAAVKAEFGEEQFTKWRRGYATPPPEGESLKMTSERTLPYFKAEILPQLHANKNVLVVAHGNSIRAILKEIEHISDEEIVKLEIPTGKPLLFEFKAGVFKRK